MPDSSNNLEADPTSDPSVGFTTAQVDGSNESAGVSLADDESTVEIVTSDVVYTGAVWNLRRDVFEYGESRIAREYVDHTGAVAIMALDDEDRVMLIKQYRHPIASREWELPAGLLDEVGESAVDAAKRELGEEVDLEASTWHLLSEFFTSPGGSNETIRVYLARGLRPTPAPFDRFDEEAELETRWVPLDEIVAAVLDRRLGNSILCIAALTAAASKSAGWASLGDAETPWTRHPSHRTAS